MTDELPRLRLTELRFRNFRALQNVRLRLGPLTILLGANGSGKSTILDGIDFLRDMLFHGLHVGVLRHGGFAGIQPRSVAGRADGPVSVAAVFEGERDDGSALRLLYGVELGPARGGGAVVTREVIRSSYARFAYERRPNLVEHLQAGTGAVANPDSLALPLLASTGTAWPLLYMRLLDLRIHAPELALMRRPRKVAAFTNLDRDCGNVADAFRGLAAPDHKYVVDRLATIVPGMKVETRDADGERSLIFKQVIGPKEAVRFSSNEVSDGTMRALAALVALRQADGSRNFPSLVGIDEFEASIDSREVEGLLDAALTTGRTRCPVIIAAHSPELLDHEELDGSEVRVLQWRDGVSSVHTLSPVAIGLMKEPGCSLGELVRSNSLIVTEAPEQVAGDHLELDS